MKHSFTLAKSPGLAYAMEKSISYTGKLKSQINAEVPDRLNDKERVFQISTPSKALILCLCFITIQICATTTINAQTLPEDNRHFQILPPISKVTRSNYNQIEFLDSRLDTSAMGNILVGMTNRREQVKTTAPFRNQINQAFMAMVNPSANVGTVLFQLQRLNFNEIAKPTVIDRKCRLRAKIYQKQGDRYTILGDLDTILSAVTLNSRTKFYRACSNLITDFIALNLTRASASQTLLSRYDIVNIDSVEKTRMNLYTAKRLTDGVYNNYQSFKNQVPDYKNFEVVTKDTLFKIKKVVNDQGEKVKWRKAYAVVYAGKPYVLTPLGNFPLLKKDNIFCFKGPIKIVTGASTADYVAPMFGLAGMLVKSLQPIEYANLYLDHLTGDLEIRLH